MPKCLKVSKNNLPSETGELYAGACVWFYKKIDGEIFLLFQKRSKKVHNGGFYDISAGGHVDVGEDVLTAAVREVKEEIGISLEKDRLEFLCAYRVADKIASIFIVDWTGESDRFVLDSEEVEAVKWVKLRDFDDFVKEEVKPNLKNDFPHFELLKARLKNGNY